MLTTLDCTYSMLVSGFFNLDPHLLNRITIVFHKQKNCLFLKPMTLIRIDITAEGNEIQI